MSELNSAEDGSNNTSVSPNPQDYVDFIVAALLVTDDGSDLERVYSLLQKNLNKLDNAFVNILRYWSANTWSVVQPEQALVIAVAIVNFSNLIRSFPYGNIAINLEIAIAGCEVVAPILTHEAFPEFWATTQNMLGAVYRIRIAGDRTQNLEQAIACYQNALQVRTQTAFPELWAETQNNLGNAYNERILGERAKNVEIAITCFQAALKVRTRTAFPVEWATTQNNLGIGYYNRLNGDRAENLEQAIICYQNALQIRTQTDFPEKWAETQNNLANAYGERIKGDRAENIEAAITAFQAALHIYTRSSYPQDWAMIQNNLGEAYRDRINGNPTENLLTAISAYEAALQIYTRSNFPQQWAIVQNNQGIAYYSLQDGDRTLNLERAISCYHNALQVRTQTDFPENWAETQNNLGNAYSERISGSREENLDLAISAYQEALQVHTREAFSKEWAKTHNNLALVYRDRGQSFEAITHLHSALEVYTPTTFPVECLVCGRNFGNIAYTIKDWDRAIEGYSVAIEAVEQSRSWVNTDKRRQEVLGAAIDVYAKIVQVHINTAQCNRALEYVERSKTRNLVELLANKNLYPKSDLYPRSENYQKICNQIDQLRQTIPAKQRQLEIILASRESEAKNNAYQQLQNELNQLQKQRDNILADINKVDSNFKFTQQVETIPFNHVQSLIDERSAIIEWYITDEKILTFIITRHSPQPEVIQSSAEDLSTLLKRVSAYLRLYYRKDHKKWWRNQLESRLQNIAEILHIDEIISNIPAECDRLILIPHRFLHLLPLHALPLGNKQLENEQRKQNCLLDKFPRGVGYAPSCQLLQLSQNQQRPNFTQLFAIQNPTGDLSYTNLEVETIGSFFAETQVLVKQKATKAALNGNNNFKSAHCCHFSCHADFNLASPLESALILANNERLTLAEIFALTLNQCRLITLSACETGIADPTSISDEYISLPSGFLYAGTPSVVSSLWTVNDLSTALLMVKFYQNLGAGVSVAVSLNQAQLWLRDVTKIHLEEWITEHQLKLDFTLRMQLRRRFQNMPDDAQPFQSPFYWAAFCAIGN
ncbi:CHAT domain-containing tetratricopeptide repeat protein [Okeanomitos corallinicola TIOX110]|uniref:CHAT domain-containing tetratricopeptide repeat protein n=1 Tax=Okeanomitos corallinicola TIOX110 TaxID=3133117 RepID=A0ABZ2UV81_9CYAN